VRAMNRPICIRLFLVITSTFLACVESVYARTFFIDSNASSNALDGRSPATAWMSVSKVIETRFLPGDTIRLKRGGNWNNQTLQLLQSGNIDAPIVITSYGPMSSPAPVIRDTGIRVVGIGASHVVVESLAVTGSRNTCVVTMGKGLRNLTLRHLEIYRCSNGISIANTDTAWVHSNYVHDITYTNSTTGAIGIVLDQTKNIKVTDNILRNCIGTLNGKSDGGAVELFRTNSDIEITRNRAHRTFGFLELGGLSGDTIRNLLVHRNIAMETRTLAWINLDTPTDTSNFWGVGYQRVVIAQNTYIHRSSLVGSPIGANTFLTDPNQIVVANNVVMGDSVNGFVYQGGFSRANNLFHSKFVNLTSKKFAWAPGEQEIDPLLLVDTVQILYKLAAGSPLSQSGAVIFPPQLNSAKPNTLQASGSVQNYSQQSNFAFRGALNFQPEPAPIAAPAIRERIAFVGNAMKIESERISSASARLSLIAADGKILYRTSLILRPGLQVLDLPPTLQCMTKFALALLEVEGTSSMFALSRHQP
jgi:hypothetical protein